MTFQDWSPQTTARTLLRVARHGSLATLDSDFGFPHASLIGLASAPCGSPLLLLSQLARHTRNLADDSRASILIASNDAADPLASPRITVVGRLLPQDGDALKQRYLARHESAKLYAGFGDFSIYMLQMQTAHLVAGFGRIVTLTAEEIATDLQGADELLEAEAGITEHMNEDHADAVRLFATKLLGAPDGDWRFIGCDPDGIEIGLQAMVLRLPFARRATGATQVRMLLVDLTRQARALAAAS